MAAAPASVTPNGGNGHRRQARQQTRRRAYAGTAAGGGNQIGIGELAIIGNGTLLDLAARHQQNVIIVHPRKPRRLHRLLGQLQALARMDMT